MFSGKHHVFSWVLSISAAVIHGFVSRFRWPETLLQIFLIPLGAYGFYFVWSGPRGYMQCSWKCRSLHLLTTSCLLVSLGAAGKAFYEYDHGQEQAAGWKQIRVIHTMLAFIVLGALEPIRQNRRDIEPRFLFGPRIHCTPQTKLWFLMVLYAFGFFAATLAIILVVFNFSLRRLCGPEVSWASLLGPDEKGPVGIFMTVPFLLAPFADMAETVFYLVHKHRFPHWIPEQGQLVRNGEKWSWRKLAVIKSSEGWTIIVLMIYLVTKYT